jgi:nitrate reductase NapE component
MVDNGKLIDDQAFHALQHPLQRRRFVLALIFALLLFPLIAVGLIFGTIVLIVPLGGVLLWIGGRVLFARFLGNSILASNLNYPRIYVIGEELKTRIGYKKTVNIFVYEQGNFNAFLMKFFFYRRAVFLNSELLESGVTDDELRWLIGRFIGYLRARRQAGFWGWTIRAAQKLVAFNIFLLPYERALVYTGDRLALAVIDGDISCAISVMQKVFVGRQLGYSVNPEGIIDQQRLVKGSVFAFLARILSGFPHMTTRYVDLIAFAKSYYPAQYARFEAGNPGVSADVLSLGAVPRPSSALWIVLAAAVLIIGVLIIVAAGWYFAGHRPVVPQTAPPTSSDADNRQEEALAAQRAQEEADAEAVRSNQQDPLKALIAEADKHVEASPTPTLPITTGDGERFPYTRTRLITEQEAAAMSYADLRYAINEMYARHGADFQGQRAIANQFRQFEWYHPRTGVLMSEIENEFSETERANVLVLAKYRDQRRASGER